MTAKEFGALLKIQGYTFRVWPMPQSTPRDAPRREPLWVAEVISNEIDPIHPNDLVSYAVGNSEKEAMQNLIKTHYANNRK